MISLQYIQICLICILELNQRKNYVFDLEVILPLVKGIYSLSVGAKQIQIVNNFYDDVFNILLLK